MPLYDFRCQQCDHRFDDLVSKPSDAECPECNSRKVERLVSVFAVRGGTSTPPAMGPGACGTCGDPRGPGSCN